MSSIEPLMSANSTVTVLRSPSTPSVASALGRVRGDFADPAALVPDVNGVVHWPQNLNWGGFSERHLGQMSASAAVHCPQNFIPPGFSKPHSQQRIVITRFRARGMVQLSLFQWALPRLGFTAGADKDAAIPLEEAAGSL